MFTNANDPTFVETIDYIILNSDDDIRMKNAISYLDTKSKEKGMTNYQTIYELFKKEIVKERSIQWIKSITSNEL
jgi:hypothetical protein